MTDSTVTEAARAMGRKGGASRSDAKRKASAANLARARQALADSLNKKPAPKPEAAPAALPFNELETA